MKCLNVLFEDANVQTYLEGKEAEIMDGAQSFSEFPQTVKDHITANLESFLDDDVNKTYANIVEFVESAAFQFLHEISSIIVEGEPAKSDGAAA